MHKFLAVLGLIAISMFAQEMFAQEQDAQPSADVAPAVAPEHASTLPEASTLPDEGRILGLIPNYKTVPQLALAESPLSVREKFKLAFKDTVDPFTAVAAGFYAGIAQWENDYAPFGQGGMGFAKRFGAAYADQGIGNYMTEAIFPSLLHEDPRYFRRGTGGPWRRVAYALSRSLITRTDTGGKSFNYSEFAGNAVAAAISTAYYPASERTAEEAGEKLTIQLVSDSAFNILLEFWPDMRHAILKK